MSRKKKLPSQRTSPPPKTEWVPISEWKIANTLPTAAPISRIRKTLRLMTHRRQGQKQHARREALLPIQAPPSRITTLRQRPIPKHTNPTHQPSLNSLENLQDWFRQFFLRLAPDKQRLLMDYLLIYNLDIWSFEQGDEHLFLDAREFLDVPTPAKKNDRLDTLMNRLSQILSQKHTALDPNEVEDRIFSDGDENPWRSEHEMLQTLLETIVLELSGDQTPPPLMR